MYSFPLFFLFFFLRKCIASLDSTPKITNAILLQRLQCRCRLRTSLAAISLLSARATMEDESVNGLFRTCRSCSSLQIERCPDQHGPQGDDRPGALLPLARRPQEEQVAEDVWRRLRLARGRHHLSFLVFLLLDLVTPCPSVPVPARSNLRYRDHLIVGDLQLGRLSNVPEFSCLSPDANHWMCILQFFVQCYGFLVPPIGIVCHCKPNLNLEVRAGSRCH